MKLVVCRLGRQAELHIHGGLKASWPCICMYDICVCDRNVWEVSLSFFQSFNYNMLHWKITDTDVSFISENTAGGTNCVEYDNNCRFEYQYLYNEKSVTEIKALRKLDCPVQQSYYRK
jgi:hypothetical protein